VFHYIMLILGLVSLPLLGRALGSQPYNPPTDGIPSFDGGIGMFLGHKDSDNSHLYQHQIYIHEKGQFWPNVNLPAVYKLKQSLNKMTQLYLHAVEHKKISDPLTFN